ncbi:MULTISPECIES: hypothetical protein [unclassified Gilliamella]|jgi:hypothetical protein|uniref:hypothetical protein n=1 Tax=unclassified Gilliamella TaxID=2685620 RepID=UPI00080E6194|nr:hypothetical protein [Gilliamella apicola]OCG41967.1 hypothetical protein A9G25_04340 [Gilliamella apicola]OCG45036.1 hypothetical protein A9G35_07085 [Gilliamella apicola]
MIIEIESFYGNTLISGKASSIGQLKSRMMKVLNDVGSENFTHIFCFRYGYQIYPYNKNIAVDYVIDLDIYHVYQPYH